MKVLLAGFNVEAETLEKAQEHLDDELTPEVISAAYARISRDPRNVNTLRREARRQVEKARRSNESIVFGLGHSSVAEHAVFNFDVMDISRLAVEAIQSFRLASFTEKSQRYIRLGKDHVFPEEIEKSPWAEEFAEIVDILSEAYEEVYSRIVDSGEDKGVAKEDARYLMPLATSAQFGMTINAREAEYMISRLASHRLAELRAFSGKLAAIAAKRAPSLVKYPHPTPYFMTVGDKRAGIGEDANRVAVKVPVSDGSLVSLVSSTEDGDRRLAAALIFSSTSCSFEEAERKAARMKESRIRELICSTFGEMRA
ncbi:MAG TPA: FAD-dependent thymidylate synthase, partial [Candidatus Krumholzibacterium sp.]|nr:FAD-dependent thymidylate synthase [Candidatus Krumholzibacterium sp.]